MNEMQIYKERLKPKKDYRNYKDWTDLEKKNERELRAREMIDSCYVYDSDILDKNSSGRSYADRYIKDLGEEKFMEIYRSEMDYLKNCEVEHNSGEDGEDNSYNSLKEPENYELNFLKVVYKEAGEKQPVIMNIDKSLANLHDLVDGLIDFVPIMQDIDLIINDEGKIRNLKPNIKIGEDYIAGNCLAVAVDYQTGELRNLTKNECNDVVKFFKENNITLEELKYPNLKKYLNEENYNTILNSIKGDKTYKNMVLKYLDNSLDLYYNTNDISITEDGTIESESGKEFNHDIIWLSEDMISIDEFCEDLNINKNEEQEEEPEQ